MLFSSHWWNVEVEVEGGRGRGVAGKTDDKMT